MKNFLSTFLPRSAAFLFSSAIAISLHAQQPVLEVAVRTVPTRAETALPDSPGAMLTTAAGRTGERVDAVDAAAPGSGLVAPKYHHKIKPGETAQTLTAADKFALAFRTRVTLGSFAGTLFAAGYQQVNNSRPHFGTDRGAFGERLGASEITGTSRAFFSYGLYASLFHQDPRYYVMGNRERFGKRALYSASRVVLVGGPGEHARVNWSNLAGSASSSALANAYYPARDQDFGKSASSFASSLGTQALGNLLDEFLGDVFGKFKHKN